MGRGLDQLGKDGLEQSRVGITIRDNNVVEIRRGLGGARVLDEPTVRNNEPRATSDSQNFKPLKSTSYMVE